MSSYRGRGLHGQIVEELGRRIVRGEFRENEPIDLSALEQRLDVSRTVMREAIKVLAAKGMLDSRQRRGTFVLPRSEWALLDADVMRWEFERAGPATMLDNLAEVRRIVEPATAGLAALRRTESDLERLTRALGDLATAGDEDAAAAADVAFHGALAEATQNEMLARIAALMSIGLTERDHAVPVHASDAVASHGAVLDAVRAGDGAAAESAMQALLDIAEKDVAQVSGEEQP